MNKVIILEGPDNIGKSYLVQQLAIKYSNATCIHFGPNKNLEEGKRVFDNMCSMLKMNVYTMFIMDRSPFGEFVYAPLYRNYDPFVYWEHVVKSINDLTNTRILFITFFANADTYSKFNLLPKADEQVAWQKANAAEAISVRFKNLSDKLSVVHDIRRLHIDCNQFDSLDQRNEYIHKFVDVFI